MKEIIDFILQLVEKTGYLGIFFAMLLESSFFPFPSEVVVTPAGYLAFKGKFSLILVILFSILGSIFGALLNYFLGFTLGRKFILKYGKFFFITEKSLSKAEKFFLSHGEITTFTGRLLPVIRQYISLPAGISKMSLVKFIFYTGFGAAIWVLILAFIGFYVGANEKLISILVKKYSIYLIIFCVLLITIYIFIYKKRKAMEE